MDDRTVIVGLTTTAISALSTFIVTRTKNRSDLTLDERKAQRDAEASELVEIAAQRKALREELREHLERAEQENIQLAAKIGQLEDKVEQAEARAERLAALLDVAGRQHARDAAIHRSAETAILRGGTPCGDSGSA